MFIWLSSKNALIEVGWKNYIFKDVNIINFINGKSSIELNECFLKMYYSGEPIYYKIKLKNS
jgi:hypothetical protein